MRGYELLDSGDGRKLESIGGVVVDRQAPQATWRPRLDRATWEQSQGVHIRSERGGGRWKWRGDEPTEWLARREGLDFRIKPTPFGHVGIFAEHAAEWPWLIERTALDREALGRPPRVLNLFAYTGGVSLALARAGAEVTHVDAAHGIVQWARENAELNGMADAPIRWIVDDCRRYLEREVKRGRQYDGIIIDPPSFGRGNRGEVWKIEDDIGDLLATCRKLAPEPRHLTLSAHSAGFTPLALENLLADHWDPTAHDIESAEMTIPEAEGGRHLPSGARSRWSSTAR